MTILPGAELLLSLRIKGLNAIEQLAAILASSLVLNCFAVIVLTLVHAHIKPVWLAIILMESVFLIWRWRAWIGFWCVDLAIAGRLKALNAGTTIAGILFFASVFFLCWLFRVDWQTVFVGVDDVGSWDKWAVQWASGKMPPLTSFYPQVIPANWSISYVLIGNPEIKMFAKEICPTYTLLTTLLFLSLAIRRRDPAYLLGGFCMCSC